MAMVIAYRLWMFYKVSSPFMRCDLFKVGSFFIQKYCFTVNIINICTKIIVTSFIFMAQTTNYHCWHVKCCCLYIGLDICRVEPVYL